MVNLSISAKTATCPRAADVLEAFKNGNIPSFKTVIGVEKEDGMYPVYIDEIDPDSLFGYIRDTQRDGQPLDDAEIEHLAADGNYSISLKAISGRNKILAEMAIEKTQEAAPSIGGEMRIPEKLRELLNEKVSEGIVSPEHAEERAEIMLKNYTPMFDIMMAVNAWRKYKLAPDRPKVIYQDPDLQESRKRHEGTILGQFIRNGNFRHAHCIRGHKSLGKNVFIETGLYCLGMPMRMLNGSRETCHESFYGGKITDNSARELLDSPETRDLCEAFLMAQWNKGKVDPDIMAKAVEFKLLEVKAASPSVVYEKGVAYEWLLDGGGFVLNEMDMIQANELQKFAHPLLDRRGYVDIEGRGRVPVNPDCFLIGTQNIGYAGAEMQNDATMSRMGIYDFQAPNSVVDILNCSVRAELDSYGLHDVEIDQRYVKQCNEFYYACLRAVEKGHITNRCLNIRGMVRALTEVMPDKENARLSQKLKTNVIAGDEQSDQLLTILQSCVNL